MPNPQTMPGERPRAAPGSPPARPRDDERGDGAKTTPEADLQPEDASSENTPQADTGEAPRAAAAMKQEHRTSQGR